MSSLSRTLIAVTLVLGFSSAVLAQVPWTNPSGNGAWFSWNSGHRSHFQGHQETRCNSR